MKKTCFENDSFPSVENNILSNGHLICLEKLFWYMWSVVGYSMQICWFGSLTSVWEPRVGLLCRRKMANCSHVKYELTGEMPSVGIFQRDPRPNLCEFFKKKKKKNWKLWTASQQPQSRIEPGTFRLLV